MPSPTRVQGQGRVPLAEGETMLGAETGPGLRVKLRITVCRAPDVRPAKALRKLKRAIRISDRRRIIGAVIT
jgi:hypothetical protein